MKKITFVLFVLITIFILTSCPKENDTDNYQPTFDEIRRINIHNNQFKVDGKRIWINGVNTPWDKWNDFGGGYNNSWWDNEFKRLKEAGINATRIWINCNGHGAININSNGTVTGASSKHFSDLDKLFVLADKHEIYIMATLLSFDHFKQDNHQADRWRAMISSDSASKSFVDNYTIPFINRYKNIPWLWSIDLINEPDWIFENDKIPWDNISYFLALNTAAIRKNSDVLVTVGIAVIKYNAGNLNEINGNGNRISDEYFAQRYTSRGESADPYAKLDFWSPHHYAWMNPYWPNPFTVNPNSGWNLPSSKPSILGECSAKGSGGGRTVVQDYEDAYKNGWEGVMAWTSNGVDANGDLSDLKPATLKMLELIPELIFPFD